MNLPPERRVIEEIALLKGIKDSFIEKDWFVTQIIKKVSEIRYEDFQLVFTGGTSLSKAHKLLQRFSEDIDFKVIAPSLKLLSKNQQRKVLSEFKETIINSFSTEFLIDKDKVFARNGNQFMALSIDYPTLFSPSEVLRPHILTEFTVTDLALPSMRLPVSSIIQEFIQKAPEVESIICTNPVENACDKLSAITWRIPDRDSGQKTDNRSVVRHIHDLAILSDVAIKHPDFKKLVIEIINRDNLRSSEIAGLSIKEKFDLMLKILENEKGYPKEYVDYVDEMTYAYTDFLPTFKQAVEKIRLLTDYILKNCHPFASFT